MTENLLTIVVPARNEEANLIPCIESLISQTCKDFQIIIVDDQSEDKTPDIAKKYASEYDYIHYISIKEKPTGWVGKNYALFTAYREVKSPYVLFIDADVRLNKHCIENSITLAKDNNIYLLSYAAHQECKTIFEYAVQPMIFHILNILYPFKGINDQPGSNAVVNGIFILIKTDIYQKAGTHEAIKNEILEDVKLAHNVEKAGGKIYFSYAPGLIQVRMYHNLSEIITGWSKNIFALLNYSILKSIMLIVLLLCLFWLPIIALIVDISLYPFAVPLLVAVFAYFCYAYSRMKYPAATGLLYPAGTIILTAIILNSIINYKIKGSVSWKNRRYRV